MNFSCSEYFPGIFHIGDPMGVHFTLIVLEEMGQAVLFDSGYCFTDPRPFIASLLEKRGLDMGGLSLLVSHAHRDHLYGARWFDFFYIHEDDIPSVAVYTSRELRLDALKKAADRGFVPKNFDENAFYHADYRARTGLPSFPGIDMIHLPGHTPGSLVLFIRQYRLLLTADNWNPTTWLFFPEALPVEEYAKNMKTLLALDFEHVLCSHFGGLAPSGRLRNYINGLRAETFSGALPVETPYPQYKTLLCHPEPDTNFIFQWK
jgi:glyoxylase-like metal-dependent hydrolase (beta-lactamase superfamily II)